MSTRLRRHDLAWAVFILVVATFFGVVQHWSLVRLSFKGELPRHLEQLQAQRRESQFQGVKTVSLMQAHALWQEGQTLFVDAREPQEYQELHIPGALNLTPETLENEGERAVAGIGKDRRIVVYCGQASCDAALKVAEKLQSLGYTQVLAFIGGFQAWDEATYPVDTTR